MSVMKKILCLLVFLPISSLACIVPPAQLDISESNGFSFVERAAEFYESTNEIKIVAPLKYQGKEFDLGIFTIYLNDALIAKTIHSRINESGVPEFLGYASNQPGFSYSISFLYGEGRCKSYEFTISTGGKPS